MIETQKYKSRFTDELVEVVRFKGNSHLIDIMDWIIDSGSRAQGDIRPDGELDLMVHERGIGLVKVKLGDFITKSPEAGFEVHSPLTFSQMYEKVSPIVKVIQKPILFEAIRFEGGAENEEEIKNWLALSNHIGKRQHTQMGIDVVWYRIELANGTDRIDIRLNNWIVKDEDTLLSLTDEEFFERFQKVD